MDRTATPRPLPRRAIALAVGLLLALAVAAPVAAHLALVSSDPADGATVTGTPERIVVTFTQDLVAGKSLFNLRGPDGALVGRGEPDPADPRSLVLVPPALAAGAYLIEWQAAGDDGHLEKGRLTFTVVEPAPSPTASPTPAITAQPSPTGTPPATPSATPVATPVATPSPAPSEGPGDETPVGASGDVLVPILAGLLLVGGLGIFLLRRGRAA